MEIANAVYVWVVFAVIVWLAATTIARARVMRPFRAWVKRRSDYWVEGVSCQYCISHHVGFWMTLIFQPRFLPFTSGWIVADFLASWLAVVGLAALIARTIGKTPPDGVLHPDEAARREEEAREVIRIRETVEELYPERRAA